MRIKITTLCENTVARGAGVLAQWGFSALVEVDGEEVLLDTGAGMSTMQNAQRLRVDLRGVDKIVLSHSHSDHTGGLGAVLSHLESATVYAHPDVFQPKYSVKKGEKPRYNGIPFRREHLESLGAAFELSREPVQIGESIMTTGQVERVTEFESVSETSCVKVDGQFKHDDILDDQSLIIRTPAGAVVVAGCAHAGIINTLKHITKLTGEGAIRCIVGGIHLIDSKSERIEKTIEAMRDFDIQKIGVSHCTGMPAMIALSREFGDKMFENNCGSVIEI